MFSALDLAQVNNHWQALARASYREELDWQQRFISIGTTSTAKIIGRKKIEQGVEPCSIPYFTYSILNDCIGLVFAAS